MTDAGRHLTLVAYDSPSASRRRRLSAALTIRGQRVQKSVFLLWLNERGREQVRHALMRIATADDSVVVMPVCARCQALAHRHNVALPQTRRGWLVA